MWTVGAGSLKPDVRVGVVEEFGEYEDALEGKAPELAVGEVSHRFALELELGAESGVVHPAVEGGSADVRGHRAIRCGGSASYVREGEYLPWE